MVWPFNGPHEPSGRLLTRIAPFLPDDVLLIGYDLSAPDEPVTQREPGKMKRNSENVIKSDNGLLPDELVWGVLKGYPQRLVSELGSSKKSVG